MYLNVGKSAKDEKKLYMEIRLKIIAALEQLDHGSFLKCFVDVHLDCF